MALPKRRFSHTRTKMRRGGQKKKIVEWIVSLVRDDITKSYHLPHRGYIYGNALYYNGKLICENFKKNIG